MRSQYNYVFDNISGTYNFVTKHQILYRVAFVVDETFSTISGQEIPNIFQLVIEKASEGLEPLDAMVSKTIETIVELFFYKVENSLIYVCSDSKDKAELRHKVFSRWYENSKHKDSIIKKDNIIVVDIGKGEVQKIYTSFMFHKQNINFKRLIEIYNQIETSLNQEK